MNMRLGGNTASPEVASTGSAYDKALRYGGAIAAAGVLALTAGATVRTPVAEAVNIAELDSGVDPQAGFEHLVPGVNVFNGGTDTTDTDGHGTNTMNELQEGLIEETDNGLCRKIVCNLAIRPIKVFGDDSEADSRVVKDGMNAAVAGGADIIGMSVATTNGQPDSPMLSQEFGNAFAAAAASGALTVIAAGNQSTSDPSVNRLASQFNSPSTITVAALDDHTNQLSKYSNYGANWVDVAAPGDYTSMSRPIVSAAAALIWMVKPKATAPEVKRIIMDTCKPRPDLVGKVACGGELDTKAALRKAGYNPLSREVKIKVKRDGPAKAKLYLDSAACNLKKKKSCSVSMPRNESTDITAKPAKGYKVRFKSKVCRPDFSRCEVTRNEKFDTRGKVLKITAKVVKK